MLPYYPIIIFLAPFLAGFINAALGSILTNKAHRFGMICHVVALIISAQILHHVVTYGTETLSLLPGTFPGSGLFSFTLYIDRLSSVMFVLISLVSLIIYVFGMKYMREEVGYGRFNIFLSLTTFMLFCLVSSSNLITLFIFWQLSGLMLYLLAHQYTHTPTMNGAFKTFIILRLGDLVFLGGIVLAYQTYGTLNIAEIFAQADAVNKSIPLWMGTAIDANTAIALLLFVGAMSKSAQFPLHIWVQDALYAPTPMHALLHAGIINAGGFLINRLAPLYGQSPVALHIIFAIGLITTIVGSSMMLTQNNIKKTLGFSTIGQMGFMIMECGLGAFALAVFHLIAHGLFKATIFLYCGNVIHKTRRNLPLPSKTAEVTEENETPFSSVTWLTGLTTTLILPLLIVLAAHGILNIPLMDFQGAVIFMFFSWVTSSQAIMTIYHMKTKSTLNLSAKISVAMITALVVIVFTYLWAVETFTYFLYPDHDVVSSYFMAAALPSWLFDSIIALTALAVVSWWAVDYRQAHGKTFNKAGWATDMKTKTYVALINSLYIDRICQKTNDKFLRVINILDKKYLRWLP